MVKPWPGVVQVGDRVRIKRHSEKFNGELGTVDSRDGYYVYVFLDCQPDNKEYPLEVYDNELDLVEDE